MPIRGDAKVGLDFQGLTGIASISIKGVSSDAPPLTVENGLPTLIADPAATRDVTATIREVAVNASALVRRLDEDISENEESLSTTLTNIESFSTALGRNAERLDRVMAGMESMTAGDVKNSLLDTTRSMRTLSDNLDKRTAEISADARRARTCNSQFRPQSAAGDFRTGQRGRPAANDVAATDVAACSIAAAPPGA